MRRPYRCYDISGNSKPRSDIPSVVEKYMNKVTHIIIIINLKWV